MYGLTVGIICSIAAIALAAPGEDGARQVFHVRDYGAEVNTDADSGPAIREAIEAAIAAGPGTEVVLEAGTYRVGPSGIHAHALPIREARDLIFRGADEGTEILLTSPAEGGVMVADCDGVYVKNLIIDHDPIPYTQGRVIAVDAEEGWFDLDLEDGYPSLGEDWFAEPPKPFGQWGMIFDADERRLKTGAPDFVFMETWEHREDRVWRLFPVEDQRIRLESMDPGDRFVHMARFGRGGAVGFHFSRRSGLSNVTVYSSQSFATGGVGNDGIHIDGLTTTYRPDTTRLLTTNSDGIHFQQGIRGPIIENCLLEGMADDSINLYYYPNIIAEIIAPDEVRAVRGGRVEPGEPLVIYDGRMGRVKAEVTAREVELLQDRSLLIRFSEPVADLYAHDAPQQADGIYNMARVNRGFVIRNNTFRNHRRHAMMIKAPGGLIENNIIDNVGAFGMVIGNDADWPEGVIPTHVRVRNNTIQGGGYTQHYPEHPRGGAIKVLTSSLRGIAEDRWTGYITIDGNTIIDPPGAAIYGGAVHNVLISDNTVEYGPDARLLRDTGAVVLEHTEGIVVDHLTVRSTRPEITSAVEIRSNVDPGPLGVVIHRLAANLTEDAVEIDDRRE